MKIEDCEMGMRVRHKLGFEAFICGFYPNKEFTRYSIMDEKEKKSYLKDNPLPYESEAIAICSLFNGEYKEVRIFADLVEAV